MTILYVEQVQVKTQYGMGTIPYGTLRTDDVEDTALRTGDVEDRRH